MLYNRCMSYAVANYFSSKAVIGDFGNRIAISVDIGLIAYGFISSLGVNGSYGGFIASATIVVADIIASFAKEPGPTDFEEPQEEVPFPKTAEASVVGRLSSHCAFLLNTTFISAIHNWSKNEAFEGELLFATENRGKKKDIPYYHNQFSAEFEKYATVRGANLKQQICLQPFGLGIAAGASLSFCRDWLRTKDMEYLAKKYENGMPFEAVALQACFGSLHLVSPPVTIDENMYKFLQKVKNSHFNLFELSALNPHSRLEKSEWIFNETVLSLLEGRNFNEHMAILENCPHPDDDESPSSLAFFRLAVNTIFEVYGNKEALYQGIAKDHVANERRLVYHFMGTDFEEIFSAHSPSLILESEPSKWSEGAYFLSTPVFFLNGYYESGAIFVFIKASDYLFYLFDSTVGAKQVTNPKEALGKMYKHYCGKALSNDLIFDTSWSKHESPHFSVNKLSLL